MKAPMSAHQVQLVRLTPLGGVDGDFRRRQRENQPAAAGVDVGQLQDVPKERAVGVGILAVDDRVSAVDHPRRLM